MSLRTFLLVAATSLAALVPRLVEAQTGLELSTAVVTRNKTDGEGSCAWEDPPAEGYSNAADDSTSKCTRKSVPCSRGTIVENGTVRYTRCENLLNGILQITEDDFCDNGKWSWGSANHNCTQNKDGHCVLYKDICKHWRSCYDGTSEEDCTLPCPEGRFRCANNLCVWNFQVCNGRDDCMDGKGSDESVALCGHNRTCRPDFIKCNHTNMCVNKDFVCRGHPKYHCGDDSINDPAFCAHYPCSGLQCNITFQCIPDHFACDLRNQCGKGDDTDENSPFCSQRVCSSSQFRCSSGQCVGISKYCDGHKDCRDGSDEVLDLCNAANYTCPGDYFTCKNRRCVPTSSICNGRNDCGDNSDEDNERFFCDYLRGGKSSFRCNNGRLIPSALKCDKTDNCGDGSDEAVCRPPCIVSEEFSCSSGKCIKITEMCDGIDHCRDGSASDESTKQCGDNFTCHNTDLVKCKGTRLCIYPEFLCNGNNDCGDSSDEDLTVCSLNTCPANSFRCSNNKKVLQCIRESDYCDGVKHCEGGEDEEENCKPGKFSCLGDQFTCDNRECVPTSVICDGINDCRDNSDEDDRHQCGNKTAEKKVLDEEVWEEMQPEDYFHAATVSGNNFTDWCFGYLISDDFILATASCIFANSPVTTARLGLHNGSLLGGVDYDVVEEIYHPDYRFRPDYSLSYTRVYNNLALLKLRHAVRFTEHIRPACLPSAPETGLLGVYDVSNQRIRNGTVMSVKDCRGILSKNESDVEKVDLFDSLICVEVHPEERQYCSDCFGHGSMDCITSVQNLEETEKRPFPCDKKLKETKIVQGMPLLTRPADYNHNCSRTLVGVFSYFKKTSKHFFYKYYVSNEFVIVSPLQHVLVYTNLTYFLPWIQNTILSGD